MADKSTASSNGSLGLGGAVFIVFLVLKLCGVIEWSWWWVTAPLWVPLGVVLVFALVAALVMMLFKK